MSGDPLTKNISRVHTFKDDIAALKKQGNSKNTAIVPPSATVQSDKNVPSATSSSTAGKIIQAPQNIPTKEGVQQTAESTDAFHKKYLTLSEEFTAVAKPQKESILSDSDNKRDSDIHASGTIIRDTKRKRFRLFPAMVSATSSWVSDVKDEYESAAHPQSRTVTKAEARVDVIQKAVLNSEQAPREDFKRVSEHLKTVERKPVTTTLSFKEKSEVPAPSWSYIEEDTVEQEEETVTKDDGAVEETMMQSEPTLEVEPTLETENFVETTVETKQDTPVFTTTIAPPEEPVALRAPAQLPDEPEPVAEEPVEEVYAQRVVSSETLRGIPNTVQRQSTFPIVIFIVVIIGASLLGISASYYFFGKNNAPQEKVLVYQIPSLVRAQTQVPVLLPTERIAFLTALGEEAINSQNTTQIYPTVLDEDGGQKPAPVEFIMEVLELRASGSFIRSIKEATFGGVEGEPFIVLKTTSFDVGFAGMLAWEEMISADLSPLFGTPVTETFDPSARTDTQVRSAFFKDTIASNKNVRLLLDQDGKDRMVYTFINQNTIVITTTKEALEELLPLVQ